MLHIRPYKAADAEVILSWCGDEHAFCQWSAGVLGKFPVTEQEFRFVEALMPFTAFDETGIVGFFTLRRPDPQTNTLRFGFVIVDPEKRGKGYGKAMLQLGVQFAFSLYGAERVTLGVFENNSAAYHCYKAIGFSDISLDEPEKYTVMNEEWKCRELTLENNID